LDIGRHPIDFSKLDVDADSQSGPLDRTVGLTGKYTPNWALVEPPGVNLDLRYMTYVKYIKSFIKSAQDEPDRVVRGHWNDGLRKYTSGSKYFKEWKAKQLEPYTSDPDVQAFSQSGEMRQEGAVTTTESRWKKQWSFKRISIKLKWIFPRQSIVLGYKLQLKIQN
jgi:hypothetical protein